MKEQTTMSRNALLTKLEKGLRLLSGLALALMLLQGTGVLTYLGCVWPRMRDALSLGASILGVVAVAAGLARSCLWISIYWNGGKVVAVLRSEADARLPERLVPILGRVTRLLVTSCVLDVLLLPGIFMMGAFFPFTLTGVELGLMQSASLLIPQTFGLGALILAYLVHQYAELVKERSDMRIELELTI